MSAAQAITNSNERSWSSWINPYHDLEMRIAAIGKKTLIDDRDKADLKRGYQLAHSWTWPAGRMKKLLGGLSTETVQDFLFKLMAEATDKEMATYLHYALNCFSECQLLGMSELKTLDKASTSFESCALTKATVLKNNFGEEGRAILKDFLVEAKQFFHDFLEMLIAMTGINEIKSRKLSRFNDPSGMNSYEARARLEMYKDLLLYPAAIFAAVYAYVQMTLPALLITSTGLIAALAAIVAYNRYWKPCPIAYAGLKNLTLAMEQRHDPIYPRADILEKIKTAFDGEKGVILVGDPGCGKTWIASSLAELALTSEGICSTIKHPQIFAFNAAKVSPGYEGISFSALEECFSRYWNEVIFFSDEIHALFKKADQFIGTDPSEEVKTFAEVFRFMVGATTTEDYEKYLKGNPTIEDDRRFSVIHVPKMTEDEIKAALSQFMQGTHSKITFDPEVFVYIAQKTQNIDPAISLLKRAIQKMTSVKHPAEENQVAALVSEIGMLEQTIIQNNGHLPEQLLQQLKTKKAELDEAKARLEKKRHQVRQMEKIEAYYLKLKRQSYIMAQPNAPLISGSPLAREWAQLHARMHLMKEFINQERQKLGMPTCLDQALIDGILAKR